MKTYLQKQYFQEKHVLGNISLLKLVTIKIRVDPQGETNDTEKSQWNFHKEVIQSDLIEIKSNFLRFIII